MADTDLHASLLQCRYHGVAQSTCRTYSAGLTKFHPFCDQYNLHTHPASSLTLQYFCVHEARHISYKTIKVYLAAIRLDHIENGYQDPTRDNLLQLVCRGIRHHQGDNQRNRLPITLNILRTLQEQLRQSSYTFQEKLMLWSAFTIAFYGFFRASEYVNLRWDDVTYDEEQMSITLHQSKTDPFRRGHTVHIFKITSSTCPLKALKRYKDSVTSTPPNAFLYHAGRFTPLSRPAVTRVIRQLLSQAGLNYMDYASHSFRIGAATTTAAAGLPAWMNKSLGRWSSNAYLSYIHCQPSRTPAIHRLLAHTDASNQPEWDPDCMH